MVKVKVKVKVMVKVKDKVEVKVKVRVTQGHPGSPKGHLGVTHVSPRGHLMSAKSPGVSQIFQGKIPS